MPKIKLVQERYYESEEVEALCDEVRQRVHTALDKGQAVILTAELLKNILEKGSRVPDFEEVSDLLDLISKESGSITMILRDIRKLIDEEIERE